MFSSKTSLYTHRRMLDAAILVHRAYKIPEDSGSDNAYCLKVSWFRKDGFDFNIRETIYISKKELKNWGVVG